MAHGFKLAAAATGAALVIASPLPAVAAEDTDPGTGTVTVTYFEDRYPDGLFDPTTTSPNGMYQERIREGSLNLIDVNGDRHYVSSDGGDYVFENVPVGSAQIYFGDPNSYRSVAFFDATAAASAADIERLPNGSYMGSPSGVLTVDVDADGEYRLVGMTALRLVADVQQADGTPVAGAAVEFESDGEWLAATEYSFRAGSYEVLPYHFYLPGELGVRITPPAGYGVAEVVAGNSRGDADFDVTERDGAWWFSSTEVADYFWNPTFTITLEELPDTTRPEVTLVSPTTAGPFPALDVQVDATDDRGLTRIVANIYQKGKLVRSTQTRLDGATAGTHTATVNLPDGDYTVKYNAHDTAGNVSRTFTADFTIDATAPKVTIKKGRHFTVENGDAYDLISFKLSDAGDIDRVEINGVVKDLTDNRWSDVNFVKPGTFGAVAGENTIVVYDVAGNTTTLEFTLN